MPMFFFCSGYFFTRKQVVSAIKNKIIKLLIPYICWNFFFLGLAFILDKCIGTFWYTPITLKSFVLSLVGNPLTSINGPAWFVITLFWVHIMYIFLDKFLLKRNFIKDLIITFVSIFIGFIILDLCIKNIDFNYYPIRYFYRILFYFQFYNLGYFFKIYLHNFFKNYYVKIFSFIICIFINVLLISFFGLDKLVFPGTSEMSQFVSIYLPLITSCTGILFYYIVCDYFASVVSSNVILEFVSQNTFEIVQLHLFLANVPNFIIYILKKYNSNFFYDFSDILFCNNAWLYVYLPNKFIYFFNSFILSLLVILILNYIKKFIRRENKI